MRVSVVLPTACLLLAGVSASVWALGGEGHRLVTRKALDLLQRRDQESYARFMSCHGRCRGLPPVRVRGGAASLAARQALEGETADVKLVQEVVWVDDYADLEFVRVRGTAAGDARDDPHRLEGEAAGDRAHGAERGINLTAFNHFLDIKHGPGLFDDYDGYAYRRGAAATDQFQKAADMSPDHLPKLAVACARMILGVTRFKVDQGLMWWFDNEYVHAPGQPWYRGCSPALQRYSFVRDLGRYRRVRDELQARFPLADGVGRAGKGVPYSVFMPVDNMARYWYGRFTSTRDPAALGPVLHAIQDASVPHHAAGYCGNWHVRYERELDAATRAWVGDAAFDDEVLALVAAWERDDPSPPTALRPEDWARTPARNWPVEQLVTWIALNAYREYHETYGDFRAGYRFDMTSARNLTKLATAMSVLMLDRAGQ